MTDVSTNTAITPNSFLGSLLLGYQVKHSTPKQPEQEIVHVDYSWGEPRELYYAIIQPESNAGLKSPSWAESPTANINLHHSSKDIIEEVLKHGLLKRLHVITQQESNEVSPPFSLTIAPLAANTDLGHTDYSTILREILQRLDVVVRWKEDWDGEEHEPERPSKTAIDRAKQVASELLGVVISKRKPLRTPFVAYDQDGYITLVWRNGKHELYLEITEDEIEYIKVWGTNIDSEMDVGVLSEDNYLTLWEWLLDG